MSETIWVMDTECCSECGCLLAYGEAGMCDDCWQDKLWDEEQDFYDGWFSDWDLPLEEVGKP